MEQYAVHENGAKVRVINAWKDEYNLEGIVTHTVTEDMYEYQVVMFADGHTNLFNGINELRLVSSEEN